MSLILRQLFGGAITALTPSNLLDASEIRQIPDNQEVFLYPDSGISIVVEVLERVEPTHFNDAIRFHFDSLAHDNSAVSSSVNNVTVVPNDRGDDTPSAILLSGVQEVPKFNRTVPDQIQVLMALYRVTTKNVDLVVTFNIPTRTGDGNQTSEEEKANARDHFNKFVQSLRIVDHGLFA